jgi:hypothetical protein
MVNNTLSKNNRQDFFFKKSLNLPRECVSMEEAGTVAAWSGGARGCQQRKKKRFRVSMVVGNLKEELGIRKLVRRTGRRNGRFTKSSYVLPSVFFFFFFPGLTVDLSGYGQLGSHVLIFCSVQYQTELRFGLWFGRLSGKLKGLDWAGLGWAWQML